MVMAELVWGQDCGVRVGGACAAEWESDNKGSTIKTVKRKRGTE